MKWLQSDEVVRKANMARVNPLYVCVFSMHAKKLQCVVLNVSQMMQIKSNQALFIDNMYVCFRHRV